MLENIILLSFQMSSNWMVKTLIPNLTWRTNMSMQKNVMPCLGVQGNSRWNPQIWSLKTRQHWKTYIGGCLGQGLSQTMRCQHGLCTVSLPSLKVLKLIGWR